MWVDDLWDKPKDHPVNVLSISRASLRHCIWSYKLYTFFCSWLYLLIYADTMHSFFLLEFLILKRLWSRRSYAVWLSAVSSVLSRYERGRIDMKSEDLSKDIVNGYLNIYLFCVSNSVTSSVRLSIRLHRI